jgi:1,4-dihydroxy-2-naphthoate polyprenyltransferase
MRRLQLTSRSALERLATFSHQVLTWVDDDGYPINVAVDAAIAPELGTATFAVPAGFAVPADREVSLTGSHIRPQPGYGYDERRHVTVWGRVERQGQTLVLTSTAAWGWDERDLPFFEYSERSTGKARRYFDALSAQRGTPIKPRLATGWLLLRATRLPFLSATIVPVVLGIAVAAAHGSFDLLAAVLTLFGASFVQLGLNVANDVFDTVQGADDANVTPTRYSGGSRVIQYGLMTLRQMAVLSAGFYGAGVAIGLVLLAYRGSVALLLIGVVGIVVSVAYTAAPLKLVYRGLGELAVALGFGPLMVLGAYVVQTQGALAWEPFVISIPIALLVASILYVNEIPDRRGDARAGKRTLPVRFGPDTVIRGYDATVAVAYTTLVGGVVAGVLPITALLALLAIPLAIRVHRGLRANYDNPYGLMALMAVNIQLHLAAGGLLLMAYVVVLLVAAFAPGAPLFLR